jgi:integrase
MLTDTALKHLKPGIKPFKRGDALGLYILVQPSGSRLWRFDYSITGRRKTAALGAYPTVSLSEAREARDTIKRQLRQGVDPGATVKAEKIAAKQAGVTFASVAADWFQRKMVAEKKSESTLVRTQWLLGILNEGIGSSTLTEIEAPELLVVLRRVAAAGNHETVKRLRSTASNVFRFGIATGACRRDPAADLKGALTTGTSTPRSAIVDPAGVGELLRAIDGYNKPALRLALQLLVLTFTRPGNVASAEWNEFDIDAGVWSIPGPKMKMREAFRIPLSRQALVVLNELHAITGNSKYLLPSRKRGRHIYANKLNIALRRIGYTADDVSAHGFRSTASTILNESGKFQPDVVEICLAHKVAGVRGLYNRAVYWVPRCELMQWYADHLDQLRQRGEIVALKNKKIRN